MSKQTRKITKNHTTLLLFYVDMRNKFESNKRQWISFRPQRWDVQYRNHHACCKKLRFVRSIYPNLPQMGQNFYHGMLMPLHYSIAKYHEFQMSFGFTRISKPGISMCAAEWRWQGVWNSFPFLAWDLSMQPRTHMWFFNQFICTWECACSSNLNYAQKMPRKPS